MSTSYPRVRAGLAGLLILLAAAIPASPAYANFPGAPAQVNRDRADLPANRPSGFSSCDYPVINGDYLTNQCVTMEWGGFQYWVFRASDNSSSMLAVYKNGQLISYKNYLYPSPNTFRYVREITVDSAAETVTLIGQARNQVVTWAQLFAMAVRPTLSLSTSASTINIGQSATLTAQVVKTYTNDLSGTLQFRNRTADSVASSMAVAANGGQYQYNFEGTQPGTYTFDLRYQDDPVYDSAESSSVTITVNKFDQTITFAAPADQDFGQTQELTASASSNLPVSLNSQTTDVCTLDGNTVSYVSVGQCTIRATQAGDNAYNAAPELTRSFTVNAVPPGVVTDVNASSSDGTAEVSFTAPSDTGGADITGYTVTASPGGITATGTSSPITVTGLTNGLTYTFTVVANNSAGGGMPSAATPAVTPRADQTITFNQPGDQDYRDNAPPQLQASASSDLSVTFSSGTTGVCTITSAGQLTFVAPGTCTITAAQGGNASFNAAPGVTRSFDVIRTNTVPSSLGLSSDTLSITERAAAVTLDNQATIHDLDLSELNSGQGDYSGASLTLRPTAHSDAGHSYTFMDNGQFSVSGSSLQSGGLTFGSFAVSHGELQIQFNSQATAATTALAQAVARNIGYRMDDTDPPATVQLLWTFADGNSGSQGGGGEGSVTGTSTLSIQPVNDVPEVGIAARNPTYVEGTAAVTVFENASVDTVEAGQSVSAITLRTSGIKDSTEFLVISGTDIPLSVGTVTHEDFTATVTEDGDSSTLRIALSGMSASPAAAIQLLNAVHYRLDGDNPSAGDRQISLLSLQDSGGTANNGNDTASINTISTVTVTPVNDAPVISAIASPAQITSGNGLQDVTLFTATTLSDVDSSDWDGGSLSITQTSGTPNAQWGRGDSVFAVDDPISVDDAAIGRVTSISSGGLQIELNDSAATPDSVQSLLRILRVNVPDSPGSREYQLSITDGDGNDNGGSDTVTTSFTLIAAPNPPVITGLSGDSPRAALNGSVQVDVDSNAAVSDADNSHFDGGELRIHNRDGRHGTWQQTNGRGGIGNVVNDGSGGTDLVVALDTHASPAAVAQWLQTLEYTPQESGVHRFELTLRDAPAGSDAGTSAAIQFEVRANHVPGVTVPGNMNVVDDQSININGVQVSDTEDDDLSVQLSVGAGTLTAGDNSGSSLTLSGKAAQINTTLQGLSYRAPDGQSQTVTLTVAANDGRNTTTNTDLQLTVLVRPSLEGFDDHRVTLNDGSTSVRLDAEGVLQVDDIDTSNFDGGYLQVSVVESPDAANDLLTFRENGLVTLSGTLAGSTVAIDLGHGPIQVGTLDADIHAGNDLIVLLNSAVTPDVLESLIQEVTFETSNNNRVYENRTLEITVNDGSDDQAISTVSMTVQMGLPPDDVIDSPTRNGYLTDGASITPSGVLNGGEINGRITSQGRIEGDIRMAPGAGISGGTIAGNIQGNPVYAARIDGATITAQASLSNVVIGAGTVVQPGVRIGANVRFESADDIPTGTDLSPALNRVSWHNGDERDAVRLDGDVTRDNTDGMSLIRAIQLLNDYEPAGNELTQDSQSGEIVLVTDDFRAMVLPVTVSQAAPDEQAGTYIDDNGDIVFVAVNRRVVLSYPVLSNAPAFRQVLEDAGLSLDYDERANLIVREGDSQTSLSGSHRQTQALESSAFYYSGRPDVLTVPAREGASPGLVEDFIPGLGQLTGLSVVYRDEQGALWEQAIVPVPADWFALKAALADMEGFSQVNIDAQGVIRVTVGESVLRGRMDYSVQTGQPGGGEALSLTPLGDLTGNGQQDYRVDYGDGRTQTLYVYP